MPIPTISIAGVGKQYRVRQGGFQSNTIRDVISQSFRAGVAAVRSLTRGSVDLSFHRDCFWALRDVAFDVPAGQVIGIIGANGAGKSTLLKVLSRITEPTTGRIEIRGRVGSLIEVGTGFHSELTGRENIFLNGAILGMRRLEITRKFDEIVNYAGVERFIDTPIKRYSSGMLLRLGFAVAAHLETEILIVDEVLAVGDAEFQRKCLATMSHVANDGRTVLFVSHNANAVKSLCDRAIWLKEGRMVGDGPPSDVLSNYLMSSASAVPERVWEWPADLESFAAAGLRRVAARPEAGTPSDRITAGIPFTIEVDYWKRNLDDVVVASIALFNEQEVLLFETHEPTREHAGSAGSLELVRATCYLPGNLFARGMYRVEVCVRTSEGNSVEEPAAICFRIFDSDGDGREVYRQRPGVIRPSLFWKSTAIGISGDLSEFDL